MSIEVGDVVLVMDTVGKTDVPDLSSARVGIVIGEPAPVVHEGYPVDVIIEGEICRVFRETIYSLDTFQDLILAKNKCSE